MLNTNKIKKITYIFPSRSRPQKFFAALDNIAQLSAQNNYEVIGVLDSDDTSMNNQEVKDRISKYPMVRPYYGISNNKIHAINRECDKISGGIIAVHSDDMLFIKHGFDVDIIEAAKDYSGLIHFPDQVQGPRVITYSIMTKDYLDIDGWIYNPKFSSVYCDDFQMDLAKKRGKYKYVNKQILEHRHPYWGYGPKDELLKKEEVFLINGQDLRVYEDLKLQHGILSEFGI